MKYYLAIWEDRHIDNQYALFKNYDDAKKWCDFILKDKEDVNEEEIEGWLYCFNYGTENDFIHIEEIELDGELNRKVVE